LLAAARAVDAVDAQSAAGTSPIVRSEHAIDAWDPDLL